MKVLVATDGSELARLAASEAFRLVAPPTAVVLLAVLDSVPGDEAGGIAGPAETPDEQAREWSADQVAAANALERAASAIPPGMEVEHRVEVGEPAATIVAVARDCGADLIVVGSHGRGMLKRVLLGSVSEHVVRNAPCAVLVVRRSEP